MDTLTLEDIKKAIELLKKEGMWLEMVYVDELNEHRR